ncbi:PTS transporter subunit IIC, partial [Spiroplasma sp. ald]|uniref:PTS transporter subunit IIC n=1 Tax=Spiroplasma sp. ald TaxID=2490849 RepID=UPI0037DC99F6
MTTGYYVLNFFKEFIGTPAILIGLFALVGCLLQRKKLTETISATIKTTVRFLIIGGGAGILAGAVGKLGNAFNLLFGINGIIANNDVIPGLFLNSLPKIVLAGSLIMICAMLLNILLARITTYKYIYLTGHVLFYLSVMFASVLNLAGLNLAEDLPIIVITGALLVSLWMIISPALLNKYVIKITKSDTLAVGHTGSLSYLFSAWIGIVIAKISRKPLKSTEEIKFPKGLSFLRNTNIAIAITMFFLYLIIYFTAWGVKGYDALYIPDTETGWKPNNAKPSDYGSYSRIFDNMESTIAQWQDSLKIVQKYKGKEINILTIDDFNKQPVDSTIWANNETPFAIKLKDENNNVYWKLIDGENIYDIIYDINRMLEYLNQYKLSYFMNNDNKADNFYTKEVKVGKYWDAYMIDDRSSIQFGEAKFEQVFTQQSTERQYTLLILDEDADKLNINDYYNFYTVFNDRGLNIGGGDINSAPQDRQ